MCGIAGYLERENPHTAAEMRARVSAMAGRLAHRGPDDHGSWAEPASGIALGHRRLAILDLSPAGHQPMHSPSSRFVIAFNGEIYNYQTLREELETELDAPLDLRGHSDTEVILAAFEHYGVEAALPRLEGMFALAVWDRRERVLWLVRDRLGKKPLYFGRFHQTLLFASELKALRAHPSFRPEIDPDAVAAYFRFGYLPAPLSIYRGVHKLPAASWMRIPAAPGSDESVSHTYWSLEEQVHAGLGSPFRGTEDEAIEELDARMRHAVRRRMLASDVPVGLFLSGGVDSSTVTALAQAQSAIPVRTFSIGMSSTQYDESPFAQEIARHLGTAHTSCVLSPEQAMSALLEIPEIFDEPFADSSAIPTLLVSRLARCQVTVALSGDGGDEMFGGYNRHIQTASLWPLIRRIPRGLRRQAAHLLAGLPTESWDGPPSSMLPRSLRLANFADKAHKLARVLDSGNPLDLYLGLISCWPCPADILNRPPSPWLPAALREWLSDDLPATSMMLADARLYMHDDILVKVDRASMAAGLEVRNPFLDAQVIELACALPMRMKIRAGAGKWIVRKVMERYIPPHLTARPKMGFAIPLAEWLRGPLRDWGEALLQDNASAADGYVDPAAARALWSAFLGGRGGLTDQVWCLLMFQAWLQAERNAASVPQLSHSQA